MCEKDIFEKKFWRGITLSFFKRFKFCLIFDQIFFTQCKYLGIHKVQVFPFNSRTVKDIKEGEEITINYRADMLVMKNWITRQTYILENFRFTCLCDFCEVEEDEKDLEEYEKYEKLWADAKEVKRQGFEFPSQPYWA